jgi:hypothetical protein
MFIVVSSFPTISPSPEQLRLEVNVTFPETTCPQAGFVVAELPDVESAGDVPVLLVCAATSVGCIINVPSADKDTSVATMYDIVVRFIHRTLGDKLFM